MLVAEGGLELNGVSREVLAGEWSSASQSSSKCIIVNMEVCTHPQVLPSTPIPKRHHHLHRPS